MKLNLVTVTGADDSTPVKDLLEIAEQYPFAEFGILLSRDSMGHRRFPSSEWINDLVCSILVRKLNVNLSGHLCGAWVRELLVGKWPETELLAIHPELPRAGVFKRWQINTHAIPHKTKTEALTAVITELGKREQTAIFQFDNVNTNTLFSIKGEGCTNVAALYDLSHGAGVLPTNWPAPLDDIYCGYAGGLSPENVKEQLKKLEPIVGDREIWIDAETHLRSDDDLVFDLKKVRAFLEAAAPYATKT